MNNLASVYSEQGKNGEAEPLYKESLAIMKKVFRDEHHEVAQSLNNLAELYRQQGKYAEAEPLYKESLAIMKKVFGDEHPDVATSLNNLALLYKTQGKYDEAEPLYKESLAIRKKVFGDEHPDVAQSGRKSSGMNTLMSHWHSIISLCFTTIKASTTKPSHCTRSRWQSTRESAEMNTSLSQHL